VSAIVRAVLTAGVSKAIREYAAAAYPHEGCGVLIGEQSAEDSAVRVVDVTSARNLFTSRLEDRYDLDPADMLQADRDARAQGRDVVGVWHSHPDHPARPSQFDTDRAWAGWVYVIVATQSGGAGDANAFALEAEGGAFAQLQLVVEEQAARS